MAVEIRIGDALDHLREMQDESVHCCVTSPPYWGLRDYGVDGQIGLEETPDEWCARLVEVFREVKRVLRDDGTLFCNVGDAYQDKQLIGQPWLLAFALRADGWYLRDAIVWHKPNPMPSSATDRCTNAYEHVFLLAKSKRYFFDAEAIRLPHAPKSFTVKTTPYKGDGDQDAGGRMNKWMGERNGRVLNPAGAHPRNVWTIATEAFSEAHFATFPTELARRCILAGTSSKGVCAGCGAPWERITETSGEWRAQHEREAKHNGKIYRTNPGGGIAGANTTRRTEQLGWQPSCKCDAGLAQATVLDPFGGAGTTALVADRLQRNAILIELNAEYAAMASKRIDGDRGDLLDIIEQPKPEQGSLCLVP